MTVAGSRRGFVVVSLCYQAFTLSDGALRMLVLLHLHEAGQTALALALLLLPYEIAGVFTNLLGGWLGARFGLKPVLVVGLVLQIAACVMLGVRASQLTLAYVMATQVLSGIAKDLAKTAAKSYVRRLAPEAESGPLFRLVAVLTGSKNVTKGLGFFLGGALLAGLGFAATNFALAGLLTVMTVAAALWLPATAGKPRARLTSVFAQQPAIQWLAVARLFLFGSRDAWFAVALPLFLVASWDWGSTAVGALLSAWVIGYGVLQAAAPALVRARDLAAGAGRASLTTCLLVVPLWITWYGLQQPDPGVWVLAGLFVYGALFAVTSSLHSWLVVAAAGAEDVAERVGFYYAANAGGRLLGTFASGYLFDRCAGGANGLSCTVLASGVAVLLAAVSVLPTRRRW